MALLNPSFEDAGVLPGEAAHWVLSAVTSLEEIAGFGTAPEQACEDFERWFELLGELEAVLTERAFFALGSEGYEAFERGWCEGVFLFELPPAQMVAAPFSPADAEHCESGWSNETFYWGWDSVPFAAGQFDGKPREDFEDLWHGNQTFDWDWDTVTAVTAMFDSDAEDREDFESGWAAATTI